MTQERLLVEESTEDVKFADALRGLAVPELMGKLVEFTETLKLARVTEAEAATAANLILAELASQGYVMVIPELQPAMVSQGVQSAPTHVTSEGEIPVDGQVIAQPIIPELPEEKVPAGRSKISDDDMTEEDWVREIEGRPTESQDTRNAESIRKESRVSADEAVRSTEADASSMANGLNNAIAAGLGRAERFRQAPGVEGFKVG